jgi:uncharacterized Zn-finger protein
MRSHTNAKPFKCTNPGCPKTFSRKDNANVHSKKHCAYSHMIQPVALQEQQKTREEVENNIKENL